MRLFLVEYRGWGLEVAVVRAENASAARDVAKIWGTKVAVTELSNHGAPEILWQYENSPDTPRDS